MKIAFRFLGIFALILVAVAGGFVLKGGRGLRQPREVALRPLTVVTDSPALVRGEHLARVIMKCVDCHGSDFGGMDPMADAGPLGIVRGPNLTAGEGGVIARYDDAALARAIRHGVKFDGTPILIMPAGAYLTASDPDVAAVVAYLRSLPRVDRVIPQSNITALGRFLYGVGQFPIVEADLVDHSVEPLPPMVAAPTIEYGKYLADIGGCTGCHGPGLSGGKIPGTPPDWKPATNISPEGLKGWTEADFVRALKEGVRPNGTPIDTLMPWRVTRRMDSTEMRAVWLFVQSMPPKAYGGR